MKITTGDKKSEGMARRQFLQYAGTGTALFAAALIASCSKDNSKQNIYNDHVDLGTGDVAILNYAYALEQLEAAFYTQVVASPYTSISAYEKSVLTDIRDHEVSHREFFKTALAGIAIPKLTIDFSSINFADRTSVLAAAKSFEDLGVSAYNGAGYMIKDASYLAVASKIASVEARHASLIRNLIAVGSFADNTVIDTNGLDIAQSPQQVIPVVNTFISVKKILAPAFGIY
ncbi:ferritin-like domain-containing protein [Mucilaginibacter jinjuensis]|uniref:Ferritin-like domain-containing protein n=1 Tax=Mucilaginibacter jinjuensis TaxID=1176721 RepID=A0ABY7T3I6_9SPHI|nr:ferritin-like domain-containing protein [Mucilaginibacter jinjuensis]WCT10833.1 ferritin-like domain-containing protein [Mucilaginibacter jinjuensis]